MADDGGVDDGVRQLPADLGDEEANVLPNGGLSMAEPGKQLGDDLPPRPGGGVLDPLEEDVTHLGAVLDEQAQQPKGGGDVVGFLPGDLGDVDLRREGGGREIVFAQPQVLEVRRDGRAVQAEHPPPVLPPHVL
eukprot:760467-Hanusia_phi.AAC.11